MIALLCSTCLGPFILLSFHPGIIRANFIAFPVSPRNSATAVAHLINAVGITHILIGHEKSMVDLANDAFAILTSSYPSTPLPSHSPIPLFKDLFLSSNASTVSFHDIPYERTDPDAVIFILHSSGLCSPSPFLI